VRGAGRQVQANVMIMLQVVLGWRGGLPEVVNYGPGLRWVSMVCKSCNARRRGRSAHLTDVLADIFTAWHVSTCEEKIALRRYWHRHPEWRLHLHLKLPLHDDLPRKTTTPYISGFKYYCE
jgi:hypothetical protein